MEKHGRLKSVPEGAGEESGLGVADVLMICSWELARQRSLPAGHPDKIVRAGGRGLPLEQLRIKAFNRLYAITAELARAEDSKYPRINPQGRLNAAFDLADGSYLSGMAILTYVEECGVDLANSSPGGENNQ